MSKISRYYEKYRDSKSVAFLRVFDRLNKYNIIRPKQLKIAIDNKLVVLVNKYIRIRIT